MKNLVLSPWLPALYWGALIVSLLSGGPSRVPMIFWLSQAVIIYAGLVWPYLCSMYLQLQSGDKQKTFSVINLWCLVFCIILIKIGIDIALEGQGGSLIIAETPHATDVALVIVGGFTYFFFLWSVSGYIVRAERQVADIFRSRLFVFVCLVYLPFGILSLQGRLRYIEKNLNASNHISGT